MLRLLKKRPLETWRKSSGKTVTLMGMRSSEGGNRVSLACINSTKTRFNPLLVVSDDFESWFIEKHGIRLCDLYYPPYNMERTGCVGCPFNLKLQTDLDMMMKYLPNERKRCELIFGPVYDEYRRIGYRLKGRNPLFDEVTI